MPTQGTLAHKATKMLALRREVKFAAQDNSISVYKPQNNYQQPLPMQPI